jgi:4,5-dihydroxyphthalate decarboxylase
MTLKLSIGASDCDRIRPLIDGAVTIDGVEARWHVHGVQQLFNEQCTHHTYDAAEFPLATYLRDLEGARRYLALPVFPSRHFRFSCVFVNKAAGLKSPADLAGKRVGIPIWDMAAAVWLRGIFEEHHGLDMRAPVYVTNGLEFGRTADEHPQAYPGGFEIIHASDDGGLAKMLADGKIDALYTAGAPSTYDPHDPDCPVTRLFDDPVAAETAYYQKTGIFPPMHIFALKREIAEANPGLTRRLYAALCEAQREARARLFNSAALNVMLPWLFDHLLESERRLGADYWAAGFAANRKTLETVIGYMRNEGLLTTDLTAGDMFDADMRAT